MKRLFVLFVFSLLVANANADDFTLVIDDETTYEIPSFVESIKIGYDKDEFSPTKEKKVKKKNEKQISEEDTQKAKEERIKQRIKAVGNGFAEAFIFCLFCAIGCLMAALLYFAIVLLVVSIQHSIHFVKKSK